MSRQEERIRELETKVTELEGRVVTLEAELGIVPIQPLQPYSYSLRSPVTFVPHTTWQREGAFIYYTADNPLMV